MLACVRSEILQQANSYLPIFSLFDNYFNFIDEETVWFKNKTYIFVMIRAIFFGSNDLVSGSVVAVQEKNIP